MYIIYVDFSFETSVKLFLLWKSHWNCMNNNFNNSLYKVIVPIQCYECLQFTDTSLGTVKRYFEYELCRRFKSFLFSH